MRFAALLATAALVGTTPTAFAQDPGGALAPNDARGMLSASVAGDVHADGEAPTVKVRLDGVREAASVEVDVTRAKIDEVVATIHVGRIRPRRATAVRWPHTVRLPAGRYLLVARAVGSDRAGLRSPTVPLTVFPVHDQAETMPELTQSASTGTFPVQGPVTYGDGFGAPRKGYSHQGQDMAAPQGTQVVAPRAGIVTSTAYQPSAAGEYVVMRADNGQSYLFAHCQRRSTAVSPGQAVQAGAPVCRVGSTGRSSGPHLHFEIWVGGWRVDARSRPVDPLRQLRAWAEGDR